MLVPNNININVSPSWVMKTALYLQLLETVSSLFMSAKLTDERYVNEKWMKM